MKGFIKIRFRFHLLSTEMPKEKNFNDDAKQSKNEKTIVQTDDGTIRFFFRDPCAMVYGFTFCRTCG